MENKTFDVRIDIGGEFMGFMREFARNEGFKSVEDFVVNEVNVHIQELINVNLSGYGLDSYGEPLEEPDEFGNVYDSRGDIVIENYFNLEV